jgi:hypothetical protein
MKARRIVNRKEVWADGTVVEAVIWRLAEATKDRPHGLKYRMYCGRGGRCMVRYDNEAGTGDHVQYGVEERPYLSLCPWGGS